jgi:hypothetical protein
MAWVYVQINGHLYRPGGGLACRTGYSGLLLGKNNPAMEAIPEYGPIPRGLYLIGPPGGFHPGLQFAMELEALFCSSIKRDGFLIHGENQSHHGYSSKGCIIVPPNVREEVAASDDKELEVRSY